MVFDINIPIQLAFYALLEHGNTYILTTIVLMYVFPLPVFSFSSFFFSLVFLLLRIICTDMSAAPLWDSVTRQFVGLMSVTDFIDILRHYHRRGIAMDDLSARTIGEVMLDEEGRRLQHSVFHGTSADTQVLSSVQLLMQHNHRFLPIMPPNEARVLSVMSFYDVLNFLVSEFREQRKLFEDSVFDLGIGTYGDACLSVPSTARLVDVLDILESADISAIPVVDEEGRVVDLYSRSDITFLATATDAASVINNLGMSIQQVLDARQAEVDIKDRLHTCSVRASLQSVFELFAEIGFKRLVAVDDVTGRCLGVVTARDLITYFCKE